MQATQQIEYLPEDPLGLFLENNKYILGKLVGEGLYGKVFKIVYIENPTIPLVIKISTDTVGTAHEIKLKKKIKDGQMVSYGLVTVGDTLKAYFIMPRLGKSLQQLLDADWIPNTDQTLSMIH